MMEQVELEKKALSLVDQAKSAVIKNDNDFIFAGGLLKSITEMKKEIQNAFKPIIESAHLAHKTALAQQDKSLKPVTDAEQIIRRGIGAYQAEQDRVRRELEAEERKKREAEAAKLRADEEKKRQAEVDRLKAEGKDRMAEVVAAQPVKVAVVEPVKIEAAPVIQGLSFREDWKFKITNPKLVPAHFMIPDEKAIGAYVRAMKSAAQIEGVEIYSEKTTIQR